ncbi:BH3 interacting domain death agonist [Esox lucius]|uniref:BH3-interacting domain death agonist n=1 Tax=Esox lucius TaxID=8010 RepID=A0AAY5KGG4_ESOLU|nr:BH3 interacting domain death agonist [Esox lucius]XP_010881583.2 BH3 interacting domain death agonist [Esox lucius]XP_010881584.2 BH3 interacting domain death agonist [Esox lucius]XP_010881585.2 BH3 interacting domain death agonist [Esox lucius]
MDFEWSDKNMDFGDFRTSTPLIFLTFLQQHSSNNAELKRELNSLSHDLKRTQNIHFPGLGTNTHEEGELQTDGHYGSSRILLEEFVPQVELPLPMSRADEVAVRAVAAGLIEIADQLERRVVAQASENLTKKLMKYSVQLWRHHLALEVEWLKKQALGSVLDQLPQERVILALTLTLVRGVCERAPVLLRNLFNTALQFTAAR